MSFLQCSSQKRRMEHFDDLQAQYFKMREKQLEGMKRRRLGDPAGLSCPDATPFANGFHVDAVPNREQGSNDLRDCKAGANSSLDNAPLDKMEMREFSRTLSLYAHHTRMEVGKTSTGVAENYSYPFDLTRSCFCLLIHGCHQHLAFTALSTYTLLTFWCNCTTDTVVVFLSTGYFWINNETDIDMRLLLDSNALWDQLSASVSSASKLVVHLDLLENMRTLIVFNLDVWFIIQARLDLETSNCRCRCKGCFEYHMPKIQHGLIICVWQVVASISSSTPRNSAAILSSLAFNMDCKLFAAAGVSKRIALYDLEKVVAEGACSDSKEVSPYFAIHVLCLLHLFSSTTRSTHNTKEKPRISLNGAALLPVVYLIATQLLHIAMHSIGDWNGLVNDTLQRYKEVVICRLYCMCLFCRILQDAPLPERERRNI